MGIRWACWDYNFWQQCYAYEFTARDSDDRTLFKLIDAPRDDFQIFTNFNSTAFVIRRITEQFSYTSKIPNIKSPHKKKWTSSGEWLRGSICLHAQHVAAGPADTKRPSKKNSRWCRKKKEQAKKAQKSTQCSRNTTSTRAAITENSRKKKHVPVRRK